MARETAKIKIRNAIGPIVHVMSGDQREEIIRLYESHREEPWVQKMMRLGFRPEDPITSLRRIMETKGKRGELSSREAKIVLDTYFKLLKAKTRKAGQKKPPRKRLQRRRPR